jgi:hypothetical protein
MPIEEAFSQVKASGRLRTLHTGEGTSTEPSVREALRYSRKRSVPRGAPQDRGSTTPCATYPPHQLHSVVKAGWAYGGIRAPARESAGIAVVGFRWLMFGLWSYCRALESRSSQGCPRRYGYALCMRESSRSHAPLGQPSGPTQASVLGRVARGPSSRRGC